MFGFIYALLALAVIVAILGIVNTLALSVRRRRGRPAARGRHRRPPQVRRMVVLEAVLIALFGAALGVVLGVVYGALLQRVLEPPGRHRARDPRRQIGWFLALGIVGGLVAALWPAFTASRLDVLRAIASGSPDRARVPGITKTRSRLRYAGRSLGEPEGEGGGDEEDRDADDAGERTGRRRPPGRPNGSGRARAASRATPTA
ncbi:MAG: FtsX-like permease family protein [Candidatus Nanopelagicales bacterium]